jgi:DNA-binding NarL/FixJ family response regulator
VAAAVSATTIRVAVIDDHPVVREGTAALIHQEAEMEVTWVADGLEAAEPMLAEQPPDVVLLDLRLGQEFGFGLFDRVPAERRPAVVVLTSYDYPQYVEAALRLGAAGYVLKTAPITELLAAVRSAAAAGMHFGVRPAGRDAPLSAREQDVVQLVVEGRSNAEIAARLGISPKTVESHLRRLFERHGLASRTELAARALRDGWLDLPTA